VITDELFDLVTSATQSLAAARLFWAAPPENYNYVGPYIVGRTVGDESFESHQGSSGLNCERFEFSCRAKVKDGGNRTCRRLAEQIRLALQTYRGGSIQNCSFVNRIDLYDVELQIHVVPVDFEITYAEAQA
jgi:hypothetical protein